MSTVSDISSIGISISHWPGNDFGTHWWDHYCCSKREQKVGDKIFPGFWGKLTI